MAAFLISFCNLGPDLSRRSLAIVEDTGERWLIDLTELEIWASALGAAGLCPWQDGYLLAIQGPEVILELGPGLGVRAQRPCPGASDMHGLCAWEDGIAVVGTGADCILHWRPDAPTTPRTLLASGARNDTLHINDICVHDGRLLASSFGPRAPGGVRSGRVFDVLTGADVLTGLREPHSVRSAGGTLYCLESATGGLYRAVDDAPADLIAGFAGYLRGLAITDTHIAVGRSAFRPRSKSKAGLERLPPLDSRGADDHEHAISGLYLARRDASDARFIDLSDFAAEIYDIVPIDMARVRRDLLIVDGAALKTRELVALNDQLRTTIRELQRQIRVLKQG